MQCGLCGQKLAGILDMGDHVHAGAFLKPEQFAEEKTHPLRLAFCESCYAVQVPDKAPEQFSNYFYHSSEIESLRIHFSKYADAMVKRFNPQSVVEIGCNDGVMLRPLADLGIKRVIGVDPCGAAQSINDPRITVINDHWGAQSAACIGKVDMIVANNVFAHLPDVNAATRQIHDALTDDGVFVFEVNHLGAMLRTLSYDWIYHEHRYYYSLLALEKLFARHGMMIFDVQPLPNHAGSIRVFVTKRADVRQYAEVSALRDDEKLQGLDRWGTFKLFAQDVKAHRRHLNRLLDRLISEGKTIAGYGACGRANTIIQYCGIDRLEYIVDDAPAKWGYFTPGSHVEIKPSAWLNIAPVDYVLVFAWSFLDDIAAKCAGIPLIVPLPELRVIGEQQRMAA